MKNRKELVILNNDSTDIKLCEIGQRNKGPNSLELSITKCPITCVDCKAVYSNITTGFRIVCRCNCHNLMETTG